MIKQENDADARVVEQFQAKKKLEEEKRVKNIEAHRRLLSAEFDQNIKN